MIQPYDFFYYLWLFHTHMIMKKFCLFLLTWILTGFTVLWADVATPNPIKMKQPDGSTVTLRLHGDEFYSWYTDLNGKVYTQNADGWWRPGTMPAVSLQSVNNARAMRAERDRMFGIDSKAGLGLGRGSNHFLVILVEFSDLKFQDGAKNYFPKMLNAEGFTENGCVGSAHDYWKDGSNGQFTPSFDVYGPITLDCKHTDFPEGDQDHHYNFARQILVDALTKLDSTTDINFAQYDNNNDGEIDNVYMFYPGYAQSNGGGSDTIWPHSWSVVNSPTYDGVRAKSYACSAELQGNSGTNFNGCGTFCHEFGHVIGLPDLYDTDYEENGSAMYPSIWNLMASGNHNSNGRIPAGLSTYERYILGYITEFESISSYGKKTLPSVSSNRGFILPTANEGEMFILEVRDGKKWDSPLPQGLLIYHHDSSDNIAGGLPAKDRWDNWSLINGFEEHPCHYIIPPVDDSRHTNARTWVFPKDEYNYHNLSEFQPVSWAGLSPYALHDISYDNGTATLSVGPGVRQISGKVTVSQVNGSKQAVAKATVLVLPPAASSPAATKAGGLGLAPEGWGISLSEAKKQALYATVTDAEGKYRFTLNDDDPDPLVVAVYATGYLAVEASVSGYSVIKDFSLTPLLSGMEGEMLTKAQLPVTAYHNYGNKSETQPSKALGQYFSAEQLQPFVGKKIKEIHYSSNATGESLYVIVEFGTQRVLTRKVTTPTSAVVGTTTPLGNVVDVSDANLVIPASTDVVVGYIVMKSDQQYYMTTDDGPAVEGGFLIGNANLDSATPSWGDYAESLGVNLLIGFTLDGLSSMDDNATLSDMGISYITPPTGELKAGAVFPLSLQLSQSRKPTSVEWYLDKAKVDGSSVTLTAGAHIVQAVLRFSDGAEDKLELRLDVK